MNERPPPVSTRPERDLSLDYRVTHQCVKTGAPWESTYETNAQLRHRLQRQHLTRDHPRQTTNHFLRAAPVTGRHGFPRPLGDWPTIPRRPRPSIDPGQCSGDTDPTERGGGPPGRLTPPGQTSRSAERRAVGAADKAHLSRSVLPADRATSGIGASPGQASLHAADPVFGGAAAEGSVRRRGGSAVWTDARTVWMGRPNSLDGRPNSLDGRPNSLDGRPNSLDGRPNSLDGRPNSLDGSPTRRGGMAVCCARFNLFTTSRFNCPAAVQPMLT